MSASGSSSSARILGTSSSKEKHIARNFLVLRSNVGTGHVEAERRAAPFTKTVPLASSLVQCHSPSLFLADGAPRTGPWILNPPSRGAGGGDSGAASMRLAIVFTESKFGVQRV